MLLFGLRSDPLISQQKTLFEGLEDNAFLSFEEVGRGLIRSIGLPEATKLVSLLLQRAYQGKRDLSQVFLEDSYTLGFAKVILEEAKYPNFADSKRIFELLEIIGRCRGERSQLSAPRKNLKGPLEESAEVQLNQYFGEINGTVLALLLPLYHSMVSIAGEGSKKQFIDHFFDRFVSKILLESPMHRSFTDEVKQAYVQNVKGIWTSLIAALDSANEKYRDVKISSAHFTPLENILAAHRKLSKFKVLLTNVQNSLQKLRENIVTHPWTYIYDETYKNLGNVLDGLKAETVANVEQADSIIERTTKDVRVNLAPITERPVSDFSLYTTFEGLLGPSRERVKDLQELFESLETLIGRICPGSSFSVLLENFTVKSIRELWQFDSEKISEKIDNFRKTISTFIAPLINQPLENLTPLQHVVMMRECPPEKLKKSIATLLREGANTEVTTTQYETKGSGFFSKLLPSHKKAPLNVIDLSKLYGTFETFCEAKSIIESEDSDRIEQAWAYVKERKNGPSVSSGLDEGESAIATEELPPRAPSLRWKRSKPEATPPTSPGASPATTPRSEHDDKKLKTDGSGSWIPAKKANLPAVRKMS